MKQLRQRAIRDLVEQRPIRTQQELAAALRERGFRATQATISRDVAELGLGKGSREGRSPTSCRRASATPRRPARTACGRCSPTCRSSSARPACCSSSGRCPGSAHAVAAALDRTRWPEIVGSIAGDDTVFVATRPTSLRRSGSLKRRLLRTAGAERGRSAGERGPTSDAATERAATDSARRSELQARGQRGASGVVSYPGPEPSPDLDPRGWGSSLSGDRDRP